MERIACARAAAVAMTLLLASGCNQVSSEERVCRGSITSTALNTEKVSFGGYHAITPEAFRQTLMVRVTTDKDRSPDRTIAASQALDSIQGDEWGFSELNVSAMDRFSGQQFTRPYACAVRRGECECFAE
jgi:hypothetical protein